jgi:hypothetical protein
MKHARFVIADLSHLYLASVRLGLSRGTWGVLAKGRCGASCVPHPATRISLK